MTFKRRQIGGTITIVIVTVVH